MDEAFPSLAQKPRLLLCVHGGGFAVESALLAIGLEKEIDFVYAMVAKEASFDGLPVPDGPTVTLRTVRSEVVRSLPKMVNGIWTNFWNIRHAILDYECDAVAVIGSNLALPAFLAARSCRRPTLFIESITRAERLSRTGSLCRTLRLIDRFYVQWPNLADDDRRILYRGTAT